MHVFKNKIDFYITNVCNLTCEHCNRFNNHDFRGWQRWSDYKETYRRWGELIGLTSATIMGGEPFLNATLTDWVNGINNTFGIEVQILTNGTRFRAPPRDLYEALARYQSPKTSAKNHLGVSIHRLDEEENIIEDIRSFLDSKVTILSKEENTWGADWHLVDKNGVAVNVYRVTKFSKSAIIPLPPSADGSPRFTLHRSDPVEAHRNCSFAQFKSYHFIKGALYKCAPAALLREFDDQYLFDIRAEERQIIYYGYQPLTVENFHTYLPRWLEIVDNPIPQCQLCPSKFDRHDIFPVRKGSVNV